MSLDTGRRRGGARERERELDYGLASLGRVVNHTAVQGYKHGAAWPGAKMKHNLNTEAGRRGQLRGQRSAAALWALVKVSELTFSNRDCTSAHSYGLFKRPHRG